MPLTREFVAGLPKHIEQPADAINARVTAGADMGVPAHYALQFGAAADHVGPAPATAPGPDDTAVIRRIPAPTTGPMPARVNGRTL